MDRNKLLSVLPPFNNKNEVLKNDQSTTDIINEIIKAHQKYAADYKKIAGYFRGNTDAQTAKNCFNFLKKNVRYVIDSGENQDIKSPSAIIATQTSDCKCYSLFIGGILEALKIPFCFRFASYNRHDKTPGHVFIVMRPNSINELWIDAVLPTLNNRKKYNYKTDRMSINSISGIGKASPKKVAKKAAGKTLGAKLKKGAKVVLKVAASPARNSFLLLVKLNFEGLATKLAAANLKKPSELRKIWEGDLGGKLNALITAINQGAKKKKLGCADCENNPAMGNPFLAAAAAAAPIIAKVSAWLKKNFNIDVKQLAATAKTQLNKKVKQIAEKQLLPAAEQNAEIEENAIETTQEIAAAETTAADETAADEKLLDLSSNKAITSVSPKSNKMIYIAAAAAAAFLILRKK